MKRFRMFKVRLAIKFPFLTKIILSKADQKRLAFAELRGLFAFFGHDVSDMTDEELLEGAKAVKEAISSTGLSVSEVEQVAKQMGKAVSTWGLSLKECESANKAFKQQQTEL